MSLSIAKLTRRRVFAAAVETTTGTGVAIGASQAAFNVYNHSLREVSPTNERQGQSSGSPLPPVAGAQYGEYSFVTELFGSGSAGTPPGWATTLLEGCGFASLSGGVMQPSTGQGTTLTMGLYNDGRLRKLVGAAGDASFNFEVGKPATADWKFMGNWADPSDVALPTPTYPTTLPPICTNMTVTVGGTTYKIPQLKIELGNTVVMRPDFDSATGYFAAQIVNFDKVKVTMSCEALASKNWSSDRKANTAYALSVALGTTSGNIITITAPNMFQSDPPQDEDKNGILYDQLTFIPARNSAAGDDHLAFTF